jgi:uncharacterized protein with NRDE domain
MCLLILSHQVSTEFPLLVAANRDEFHGRPTAHSGFWADHPALLAGRDLQQGGTWMGVTRSGRFAAVTNYRDPAGVIAAPCSRGDLPLSYLTGAQPPEDFLGSLTHRARDYAGFNLLVGDRHSLWYYSNSDNQAPRRLSPGIYGLSNAALNTPWPKVELGKARMLALQNKGEITHNALAAVVANQQMADQDSLSRQGLDGEMDPILSAQFIVTDTYGTRSSTTMWTEANARTHWREQSFSASGALSEVQQKAFNLEES